jgi:hypothetical protein
MPVGGFVSGCVSNIKSGPGEHPFPPEGPASKVWLGSTYSSDLQFSVGESVILSPRAGCVNCACPVR